MSTNFQMPHPLQGAPQAQTDAVFRQTEEREAQPVGSTESHQPIPVPVKLAEGYKPSSLTSVLGIEPGETVTHEDVGFGPRIVILHHYVTGPRIIQDGDDRPAYERGQVIWLSALFGNELTQKALDGNPDALRQIRRYTVGKNPAFRQATKDEEKFQRVTFIEGEQAMGDALQKEQVARTQMVDENARYRSILERLNINPNASPEEIEAQLNALDASRSEPNAPPVPPPIVPPQQTQQTVQRPTQVQQPQQTQTPVAPQTPVPTPPKPPENPGGTGGASGF